jgi:hypothetical protein
MRNIAGKVTLASGSLFFVYLAVATKIYAGPAAADIQVQESDLNFQIPTFGELLSAMIKFFFVVAGLAALFYLLWGALSWITSGGDADAVSAARGKITSALIGVVLIVAVLAIIWSVENIIFNRRICLGLSCPVTLPNLLKAP